MYVSDKLQLILIWTIYHVNRELQFCCCDWLLQDRHSTSVCISSTTKCKFIIIIISFIAQPSRQWGIANPLLKGLQAITMSQNFYGSQTTGSE